MKIIFLEGGSNTGKTTTLNDLFNQLKPYAEGQIESKQLGADPLDRVAVIPLKGKLIGICSLGDYKVLIFVYLGYLLAKGCSTVIMANSQFSIPRYLITELGGIEEVVEKKVATDEDNKRVVKILKDKLLK